MLLLNLRLQMSVVISKKVAIKDIPFPFADLTSYYFIKREFLVKQETLFYGNH